jgi:hypothetical protein
MLYLGNGGNHHMLKFSFQNSKLNKLAKLLGMKKKEVISFDLPAGFTCPAASLCRAYANRETGKITKGKDSKFLCYAAKIEAVYPSSRRAHWHNFDQLKPIMHDTESMVRLINESLPASVKVLRIHSSGDFMTEDYFKAWVLVARAHPDVIFFAYTKVLPYMKAETPDNFKMVYSMGGKWDNEYTKDMPACTVVSNGTQAEELGLPVACKTPTEPNDFHHIVEGNSFAICLH